MTLRIVVADQSEARFYDVERGGAPLQPAGRLSDPAARQHDRDFKSDRPGRVFDHAPGGGRRGATGHHSTGADDRSPRAHEAQRFAQRLAQSLEQAYRARQFDRLMLVAGPRFLGALRAALDPALQGLVAAELHKDLVHEPDSVLSEHVASQWPLPGAP